MHFPPPNFTLFDSVRTGTDHLVRLRRRIGVAAVAAVALVVPVAGIVGGASAATPAVAATPVCATSRLVVWLDTFGNGTAGSTYYNLELTNLSGRACTLRGYPGVSAVNLTGHQIGRAASRDRQHSPAKVKLAGGATATVILRIVDAGNFPSSACHQVLAAGLRVYPPDHTTSKVVPFPFPACSGPGPVYLSVEAVQK